MSGPYDCLVCSGHGRVERGFDDEAPLVKCTECNGTGERWLETVFCPSQEDRALGRVEYVDGGWRFKADYMPERPTWAGNKPIEKNDRKQAVIPDDDIPF